MTTRPLQITHLLLPLLTATLCSCASSGSNETVDQHITARAHRLDAHEHLPARMIAMGDLDGDAVEDTAVIYTLEGTHSNSYQQFLSVSSSRRNGRFTDVVAGGKEVRGVDGISIIAGRVELGLLEYKPSDASCCPSLPASTSYTFKNGTLVENKSR